MQRVTNCIIVDHHQVLLIKKPRRGWYAIPGGKMEQGETIKESVIREVQEETALNIHSPQLAGVFTFSIFEQEHTINEWMMFKFITDQYSGSLTNYCEEGELEWVAIDRINELPMAEGDLKIFDRIFSAKDILYGAFSYTSEYDLVGYRLEQPPSIEGGEFK